MRAALPPGVAVPQATVMRGMQVVTFMTPGDCGSTRATADVAKSHHVCRWRVVNFPQESFASLRMQGAPDLPLPDQRASPCRRAPFLIRWLPTGSPGRRSARTRAAAGNTHRRSAPVGCFWSRCCWRCRRQVARLAGFRAWTRRANASLPRPTRLRPAQSRCRGRPRSPRPRQQPEPCPHFQDYPGHRLRVSQMFPRWRRRGPAFWALRCRSARRLARSRACR